MRNQEGDLHWLLLTGLSQEFRHIGKRKKPQSRYRN
jgi:hypothetical protein